MFTMVLREMALIVAQIHDLFRSLNEGLALHLTDKDLHFIIMALLGMVLFFVVHFVFKRLAKWSITVVSFIYVFTVMAGLGLAIEIGQKITGTGNMDFADMVAGLYGVLAFFGVYSIYRLIAYLIGRFLDRKKG